jgi:hypothetical protein
MTTSEEDSKHISLDRARELLGDTAISDEELIQVMDNLKQFCSIVSAVYKQEKRKEEPKRLKNIA